MAGEKGGKPKEPSAAWLAVVGRQVWRVYASRAELGGIDGEHDVSAGNAIAEDLAQLADVRRAMRTAGITIEDVRRFSELRRRAEEDAERARDYERKLGADLDALDAHYWRVAMELVGRHVLGAYEGAMAADRYRQFVAHQVERLPRRYRALFSRDEHRRYVVMGKWEKFPYRGARSWFEEQEPQDAVSLYRRGPHDYVEVQGAVAPY